jgi:hypothetical protein
MKKYIVLSGMSMIIFAIACKKDSGSGGGGGGVQIDCNTVTFSGNIGPLIASRCTNAGCHDASSTNGPGPLTSYAAVFASRFSIQSAVNTNRMPQGGPFLSDVEKARIKCWIDAGAPNN